MIALIFKQTKTNQLLILTGAMLLFSACSKSNNASPATAKTTAKDFTNATAQTVTVSTLAGNTGGGNKDGTGIAASFFQPSAIATDANDNLYVTDYGNSVIRKITPAGVVTTTGFAGYAAGGIAVDNSGNFFLGSTYLPGNVFRIAADGTKSTWPILNVTYALVYQAVDKSGNDYVSILGDNAVYKVTSQGVASKFAVCGDGLHYTRGNQGIAVDAAGDVFVTTLTQYPVVGFISQIYKISPAGVVSLYAGTQNYGYTDGPALAATFTLITGMAVDKNDNLIFIDENKVRMISSAGVVSTLAGLTTKGSTDGTGDKATFSGPTGITVNNEGTIIYVTDNGNNTIRKITVN